ncbi:aminoglycoside 6'-acetyltransferase [Roseovarius sp. TE539]|uniref:aminoglycoside 6'-N-acetyltransferase n=1 Tax=Roseovarius sp. TE539 TaxID=2249812 RepID=UPI000DDC316A|nr:aminoglycoside 6'-N-acetyltransferase [Roseovarius sp. TE539]RBI67942.1 aminoglycoside 6'-acetyltransferase [Roseovarius sp. TE539]
MPIRIANSSDIEAWADLRAQLWPDASFDEHRDEIAAILARPHGEYIAFLEEDNGTGLRAFAEAALRRDHVNGCETTPVAFLEGIFVRAEHRGCGIGGQLLRAVQSWARERGCTELGSDADLANTSSHAFHAAVGFEETERVVFFRMPL